MKEREIVFISQGRVYQLLGLLKVLEVRLMQV